MSAEEVACAVCRGPAPGGSEPVAGLRGEPEALRLSLCSPACGEQARRFAARRSAERAPSVAGLVVAVVGAAAGLAFLASGRDLGGGLLVLALLGAGTTRLAYPDALPERLVARFGIAAAREAGQWLGVALCLGAVALAVAFVLGR